MAFRYGAASCLNDARFQRPPSSMMSMTRRTTWSHQDVSNLANSRRRSSTWAGPNFTTPNSILDQDDLIRSTKSTPLLDPVRDTSSDYFTAPRGRVSSTLSNVPEDLDLGEVERVAPCWWAPVDSGLLGSSIFFFAMILYIWAIPLGQSEKTSDLELASFLWFIAALLFLFESFVDLVWGVKRWVVETAMDPEQQADIFGRPTEQGDNCITSVRHLLHEAGKWMKARMPCMADKGQEASAKSSPDGDPSTVPKIGVGVRVKDLETGVEGEVVELRPAAPAKDGKLKTIGACKMKPDNGNPSWLFLDEVAVVVAEVATPTWLLQSSRAKPLVLIPPQVFPHPNRFVPWLDNVRFDIWAALFFVIPSMLYVIVAFLDANVAAWFGFECLIGWSDRYGDYATQLDELAASLFVFDAVIGLTGRYSYRRCTPMDERLHLFQPWKCEGFFELDWAALGDLLFFIGGLVDCSLEFNSYDMTLDYFTQTFWMMDALFYMVGCWPTFISLIRESRQQRAAIAARMSARANIERRKSTRTRLSHSFSEEA